MLTPHACNNLWLIWSTTGQIRIEETSALTSCYIIASIVALLDACQWRGQTSPSTARFERAWIQSVSCGTRRGQTPLHPFCRTENYLIGSIPPYQVGALTNEKAPSRVISLDSSWKSWICHQDSSCNSSSGCMDQCTWGRWGKVGFSMIEDKSCSRNNRDNACMALSLLITSCLASAMCMLAVNSKPSRTREEGTKGITFLRVEGGRSISGISSLCDFWMPLLVFKLSWCWCFFRQSNKDDRSELAPTRAFVNAAWWEPAEVLQGDNGMARPNYLQCTLLDTHPQMPIEYLHSMVSFHLRYLHRYQHQRIPNQLYFNGVAISSVRYHLWLFFKYQY